MEYNSALGWISQELVAHTCNPSYSGDNIRRTVVQREPRKIV
jgi:hypothetical protein